HTMQAPRAAHNTEEAVMSNVELRSPIKHEAVSRRFTLGGTTVEVLRGLTAIALAIISLARFAVVRRASTAVLATVAALLSEGASVARTAAEAATEGGTIAGGIGADSVGGIAAVALGILSLIGLDPRTLLPIAAIVLGAGMLIASGIMSV